MVTISISMPSEEYFKLVEYAQNNNLNDSKASRTLIKLGLAYNLLLKEQGGKK